jgi:hypothetical protein
MKVIAKHAQSERQQELMREVARNMVRFKVASSKASTALMRE